MVITNELNNFDINVTCLECGEVYAEVNITDDNMLKITCHGCDNEEEYIKGR